jgi:glycosyltransferase involved in cell wall biosynthesis
MIVVIVDSIKSALGFSALARQEYEDSVILAANEYATPSNLLKAVETLNPTVVLFSFRNVFLDALSNKVSFSSLMELHKKAIFGLLIPDYLEIENSGPNVSGIALSSIDFLLTTNFDLESKYKNIYGGTCHISTYHDLVDMNLINSYRNIEQIESESVIWIGNSKWGKRQGKVDHKGFREVITPLTNSLRGKDVEFKIVDSAKKRRQHHEVLQELSKSSILLHPSKSEGTGLPILEAALMGCYPITTNVGIAQELLGEQFPFLIIDRNFESFETTIRIIQKLNNSDRYKLVQTAENFLQKILSERIPRDLEGKKTTFPVHINVLKRILLLMRWNYRYFISRRR